MAAAASIYDASTAAAAARAPAGTSLHDHGVIDIDALDSEDPQQFAEYAEEVYGYFREVEVRNARTRSPDLILA
jgi:hypothetical protein